MKEEVFAQYMTLLEIITGMVLQQENILSKSRIHYTTSLYQKNANTVDITTISCAVPNNA